LTRRSCCALSSQSTRRRSCKPSKPRNEPASLGRLGGGEPAGKNCNLPKFTDPNCYAAKLDAHVKAKVAAKPELLQITTAYGKLAEGSPIVPRGQYVEIRQEKSKNIYLQEAPEYKTRKFITEAIVADGTDKGEIRKLCANPDRPVHHPKKQQRRADAAAATRAAQEKQRREEAIANTTGTRVLAAIADAIPERLM
jgi:ParB family transcriptional regulator, chromosome partitioning protein